MGQCHYSSSHTQSDPNAQALLVPFIALSYKLILIGSGRHYAYIQYVMPRAVVDASEVYDFAAHIIYTTSLLVCRLSGLALSDILVEQHHTYVLALRMIAAFIIMSYLPQLFLLIFHCLPVTGLWPYNWQLPAANEYKRLAWGIVYSVNTAVSLCNDFLLYGIPAVMLWRLDCRESGRSSSRAYYALESFKLPLVQLYTLDTHLWQGHRYLHCPTHTSHTRPMARRSILAIRSTPSDRGCRDQLHVDLTFNSWLQADLR